ncbi:MAG TPA: phosphatase PAP2 family protein [Acidimicrobiales bacterium]|nr:phosphatase PAP2 family protein [Acidimicrobiales bacterium]
MPLPKITFRIPSSTRLGQAVDVFDKAVDSQFDRVRGNPVIDRIFYGASELGDHGLIWLLLGALRGLRSEHDWHAAVRLGLGVGLESALVNLGIKSLFRRQRPAWELDRPMHLRRPRTSSFPSGHSTSAFTAAALLGDQDRLKPVYYVVAIVVAWSRVYVKIHHASDVVAGILVGALLGKLGKRLYPLPYPPNEESVRQARG